jgi:hypothetical protein
MSNLNQLDALSEQLRALSEQLAKLKSEPSPPLAETPRTLSSTAAERIRQLVLKEGRASMPELQRALKLEKSAAHYYARKLAAEGRVVLAYEPHAASHSLVLVAHDPSLCVLPEAKALAKASNE